MTEERIIAYLLEELPEADQERFEDECLLHDSWPTEINLVEEDLIDSYLRNELTPERRKRFEENYLTTLARQERVLMAAALLRQVDDRRATAEPASALSTVTWADRLRTFWSSQTRTLRAAAAMAVITAMAAAIWFLLLRPSPPQTVATITLALSQNNRSTGVQAGRLRLSSEIAAVKVFLTLPQPAPAAAGYRVELESDDGATKPVEVVEQNAEAITVIIPAVQLARRPYSLKLFAIQADGSEQRIPGNYFLTVE